MWLWLLLSALLGLAVLLVVPHSWGSSDLLHTLRTPRYWWSDLCYTARTLRLALRLTSYKRTTRPFYSVLERFLEGVRRHPERPFVLWEDRSFSYGWADRRSSAAARCLQRRAGVREADAVALFLGNEPNYIWLWLGLSKLGCPAALINCNIRNKGLLHCLSCSGAKTIITSAELREAVEEVLPALTEQGIKVFLLTEEQELPSLPEGISLLTEQDFLQESDQPLNPQLRENVTVKSIALYIYTSGTTGLPKAALVTQERVWAASFIQASTGVTSQDVFYINLPLYHSAGFLIGLAGCIERGNTLVLRRKFSASQFWDDCRKYNVTVMQYIGETLRYLCSTPKREKEKDHGVRIAIGNGVRSDVWAEFLRRFGDIAVRELYAATEGNIGFINYTDKIGAVGRVNFLHSRFFPYTLIKFDVEKEEPVRNSEGLCVAAERGESGLLVGKITKISPFVGYAGNRQQTEKKRLFDVQRKGDQFFNTGDLLWIDQDNFVYFKDRVGDTFRWKGENVATSEVADVLTMVNCIAEANVYGVKVEGHEGRIGMAAVILTEGSEWNPEETFKHVCSFLPSYARPRFIRIQICLEMTGTFKMKKVRLVEEGFDPQQISDPLYFLDSEKKTYVVLSQQIYKSITAGNIKL